MLVDRMDDASEAGGVADEVDDIAFAVSGALGDYESLAREDAAGLGL